MRTASASSGSRRPPSIAWEPCGSGESYSDVILRLVEIEAGRGVTVSIPDRSQVAWNSLG